ncbi:hypothetical protein DFH08DRAFT_811821 [Mycena albidolilacea]|uniref:Uncharacterized protein n=1 Tax=Mycena albidolilacea TaxID=1033008 RepID=A0AAD6ZUQ4_9AGAR|nr:hypothetical protein DFH08DRAFT_811821 [Mycena albidolilacea]
MGDETHKNEDLNSGSPIENPGFASYGVFSGSQHFTVAGYRRIPMGDINLQHEIRLNKHSGVADYRCERRSVRRVYSAKIDRGKSSVTVAMYHGEKAEEFSGMAAGCCEIYSRAASSTLQHHIRITEFTPAIQIVFSFAALRARGISTLQTFMAVRSTIFENGNIEKFNIDLIPVRQFMELHRHSPISNTVRYYFHSTFHHFVSNAECTFFIRRSTGRICVDLAPGNTSLYPCYHLDQRSDQPEFQSLNTPSLEATVLNLLTLEEYHEICYWQFSLGRDVSVCNPITVNPGTFISCSSGNRLEDLVEIAFLPRTDSGPNRPRWDTVGSGVVMGNGWTHVGFLDWDYWLSQANHIFSRLGISSNFEDYECVWFDLSSTPSSTVVPSDGFLYLCPAEDFQIGPSSFEWPDRPAYWSLDPTGADPLGLEDAANLGFPSLRLFTEIRGGHGHQCLHRPPPVPPGQEF